MGFRKWNSTQKKNKRNFQNDGDGKSQNHDCTVGLMSKRDRLEIGGGGGEIMDYLMCLIILRGVL